MYSPLRILSVEDDPTLGEILSRLLTQAGHEVVPATNGQRAWEIFESHTRAFDLVITDHEMPLLTGLELVELLRKAGFAGRIIVHCSQLTPQQRERYVALEVARILKKPTEVRDLLQAVGSR